MTGVEFIFSYGVTEIFVRDQNGVRGCITALPQLSYSNRVDRSALLLLLGSGSTYAPI
jgi:hypothetical protein